MNTIAIEFAHDVAPNCADCGKALQLSRHIADIPGHPDNMCQHSTYLGPHVYSVFQTLAQLRRQAVRKGRGDIPADNAASPYHCAARDDAIGISFRAGQPGGG